MPQRFSILQIMSEHIMAFHTGTAHIAVHERSSTDTQNPNSDRGYNAFDGRRVVGPQMKPSCGLPLGRFHASSQNYEFVDCKEGDQRGSSASFSHGTSRVSDR